MESSDPAELASADDNPDRPHARFRSGWAVERADPIRYAILGPIELYIGRQLSTPSACKLRTLLAALVIRRNSPVSIDTLLYELWGEESTPTAVSALRVYISQLRRLLTKSRGTQPDHDPRVGHDVIITKPPGYLLQLPPGSLDVLDFERLRQCGDDAWSAGRAEAAAHAYREALRLWRGPALADVRTGPVVDGGARRLDEGWISTVERCFDADLELGRHRDIVGDIRAVVADHPLHEGLHARLMVALHRSGRTSEALEVYRSARRLLADELGVEPGDELRRTHEAVLRANYSRHRSG